MPRPGFWRSCCFCLCLARLRACMSCAVCLYCRALPGHKEATDPTMARLKASTKRARFTGSQAKRWLRRAKVYEGKKKPPCSRQHKICSSRRRVACKPFDSSGRGNQPLLYREDIRVDIKSHHWCQPPSLTLSSKRKRGSVLQLPGHTECPEPGLRSGSL